MSSKDHNAENGVKRREAIAIAATALGSLIAAAMVRSEAAPKKAVLRPPGALLGSDFSAACIRCFQCGSVCPSQCIQFRSLSDGLTEAYTPYIEPREIACILCMKCTEICPTDALTPITNDPEVIATEVKMGTAWVNEGLCYSFNDRICGVCYYACPYPDEALRLGEGARPYINEDACVGCGNCERACIHLPQAVRIEPASEVPS